MDLSVIRSRELYKGPIAGKTNLGGGECEQHACAWCQEAILKYLTG
jgi:hypothetical protein